MPPARSWLWFALILLANFLLVRFLFPGPEAPVEVPYTFFKEEVRAGNVEAIYSQGDTVEGSLIRPKVREARSPTRRLRAPPRPSPLCFRHSLTPGSRSC
jgi:cell division protease FtsH